MRRWHFAWRIGAYNASLIKAPAKRTPHRLSLLAKVGYDGSDMRIRFWNWWFVVTSTSREQQCRAIYFFVCVRVGSRVTTRLSATTNREAGDRQPSVWEEISASPYTVARLVKNRRPFSRAQARTRATGRSCDSHLSQSSSVKIQKQLSSMRSSRP